MKTFKNCFKMTDWKEVRLGDLILDIAAGPFGSNLPKSCFTSSGFPIIDGANLKEFKVTDNITKFVSEEKARSLHRAIAKRGDVVVTISGTVGQISYIPQTSVFTEYLVSQRQFRCTFDTSQVNVPYLVYYFHSYEGSNKILQFANQVGVPALSQPLKNFKNIHLKLPPIAEQRKIVAILSALDDKIEMNRRINARLEELAQTIFKSWFIDFAPFGGQMPEDWKMGTLSDIIIVKYGKDHKKLQDGNVPVYGSGGIMRFVDKSLYSKESVLIPRKGTLNNIIYVDEPFWSVDTMFYSEMKYENIAKYIFFVLSRLNFKSMNSGSAIPSMTTNILNALPIVIPNSSVLERFEKNISPIFSKIKSLSKESARLAEMRDALLPRLMSGEYSEIFENSEYFEGSENSEGYEGFV